MTTTSRQLSLLVAVSLGALLGACGDARRSTFSLAGDENLCVACHGGQDNQSGAPPFDLAGRTDTALAGVGAHTSHVQAGPLAPPFACAECHEDVPRPATPLHLNGEVDLPFGALSRTGGASPTYDPSTPSCSATYCHGATLQGGTHITPVWTRVGQGEAACGACHGRPPAQFPSAAHPRYVLVARCVGCHPGTAGVDTAGNDVILAGGGLHVNGVADYDFAGHPAGWYAPAGGGDHTGPGRNPATGGCAAAACHGTDLAGGRSGIACSRCHDGVTAQAFGCVTCHGGADNQTGAPPIDTHGVSLVSSVTVGAHTSHVQATHALSFPIDCGACHVKPASIGSPGHIDGATASVVLSTAGTRTGTTPIWDRTTAGCSSSYCHGNFPGGLGANAPVWTTFSPPQAACGSCHVIPSSAGTQTGEHRVHLASAVRCDACHATGTTATTVEATTHVNGVKDVRSGNPPGWDPVTRRCNNTCHTARGVSNPQDWGPVPP
jgi:predicted CxxxxCH...CXXCH cytochrome family protein